MVVSSNVLSISKYVIQTIVVVLTITSDFPTVPLKGGQKGILASRNRKLGKIWKSLPKEHQEVFHPSVFYILSGLTPPSSDSDIQDDDDDEENESQALPRLNLEPERRAKLQAVYDEIVCKDKVAKEYAKVAAGMGQGPSLPDYNRQSLKCIERLHTQVMYFTCYYFFFSWFISSDNGTVVI